MTLSIPLIQYGMIAMLFFARGWGYKAGGSHLFALLKIMAESDGPVNSKEALVYEEFCQANMEGEPILSIAKAQFIKGVHNPLFGFEYHLKRYIKVNKANPHDYQMVVGLLAAIAEADDGPISEKESALMNLAVKKFGLDHILPLGLEKLLGMLAKLAKADSVIKKEEIAVVEHFFKVIELNENQIKQAIDEFQLAKNSTISFSQYTKEYAKLHENNQNLMEMTFELLMEIALADDAISPEEASLLEEAAEILNIQHSDYNYNYDESSTGTRNEAYYAKVLGLEPGYSIADIRKRYRILMTKNHPDKVANLSDAIRKVAEDESKKIINAYEFFKNKYENSAY